VPRITDFCICVYVFGWRSSVFRLCDSDFGITAVDGITIGITCAVFRFHIAHISLASSWCLVCLSVMLLARFCVFGTVMCVRDSYVGSGQLCVFRTAMCVRESYVCSGELCVFATAMCIRDSYVCSGQLCVFGTAVCVRDSYVYQKGVFVFFFLRVMSGLLAGIILSVVCDSSTAWSCRSPIHQPVCT
jgi:hypothetical protein